MGLDLIKTVKLLENFFSDCKIISWYLLEYLAVLKLLSWMQDSLNVNLTIVYWLSSLFSLPWLQRHFKVVFMFSDLFWLVTQFCLVTFLKRQAPYLKPKTTILAEGNLFWALDFGFCRLIFLLVQGFLILLSR